MHATGALRKKRCESHTPFPVCVCVLCCVRTCACVQVACVWGGVTQRHGCARRRRAGACAAAGGRLLELRLWPAVFVRPRLGRLPCRRSAGCCVRRWVVQLRRHLCRVAWGMAAGRRPSRVVGTPSFPAHWPRPRRGGMRLGDGWWRLDGCLQHWRLAGWWRAIVCNDRRRRQLRPGPGFTHL